ncbi:hypothetical protein KLP28_13855 [Nocardioidaceae bacterium]|nr:hypothetical protein KLP28_13855 [Nocardioidaceae bacterium]
MVDRRLPRTVHGVIERMREIDAELPPGDGVGVFNHMYLEVTQRIEAILAGGDQQLRFRDPETLAKLDVRFANLWLRAYDAAAAGGEVPTAWQPLFDARAGGRWPIQYALGGMNTHIEHDLPLAVVDTCVRRGLDPEEIHADYEAVNVVLAQVESGIRRSFLTSVGQAADDRVGPAVHLVSAWSIDKARDLSWTTVQLLWALRDRAWLDRRVRDGLASTVGMASRTLLAPTR